MKTGFIGLGNVGKKLAGSVLRHGFEVRVLDADPGAMSPLLKSGALAADSPMELARASDLIITCLPNPATSAEVMEGADGVLAGLSAGKIWAEMSTSDAAEVRRLGALALEKGAEALDCPVSGGCHRAATGNISIFAGCERKTFERVFPILKTMGRRILHTGPLGSASLLKTATNYLATAHLLALCETFVALKAAGADLDSAYEAIRISSGNSFVHESEGQVILNGSRNINFTMDLMVKDVSLFAAEAERAGVDLELAPMMLEICRDGEARFGGREWSSNVIRRLEEKYNMEIRASGFPAELVDDEPEAPGEEIIPRGRGKK